MVTGANAGDGVATEVSRGHWQMTGPNDGNDNGWIYVKKQFPLGAAVTFDFSWNTPDDGGCCDWVIANVDNTEPSGIPSHGIDSEEAVNPTTPYTGSIILTAAPGQWVSFGIYSTDSCCGSRYVNFSINENW